MEDGMLRNIPVELSGHKLLVVEAPEPKMRQRDDGSQELVVDSRDGSQMFTVTLNVRPVRREGVRAESGAEVKVTLETDPGDEVMEGSRVELINPRVSHWQTELNGRTMSGLAWRATGIKLAGSVFDAA